MQVPSAKDIVRTVEEEPAMQQIPAGDVKRNGGQEQRRQLFDYGQQMYPLLTGIYGDAFTPFDPEIQERVRTLLSKIMHLLDASQEGLKVKDFGGHNVEFVRVPHKSQKWIYKIKTLLIDTFSLSNAIVNVTQIH